MADENDLLPTPANYATPNQLTWNRELAKALLIGNQAKGNGAQFQPVGHWSQGVSNIINALVGGKTAYDAGQNELGMYRQRADVVRRMVQGDVERQGAGRPVGFASPEDANPMPVRAANPTPSGGGMGRGYTPGIEPDGSPLYEPKGTPPDNMSLGGDGGPSVNDRFGPFGGKPAPSGSALPFNPTGSAGPMTAQDAITQALSKGAAPQSPFGDPAGALALSKPKPAPYGPGSPADVTYIDPRTLPKVPQISPRDITLLLSNPMLSPEERKMYQDMYIQQVQPLTAPYTGGNVRIDRGSGAQQFIPDPHWGKVKAGDVEFDRPQIITPQGVPGFNFKRSTIPNAGGAPAPGGNGPLGTPPPGPNVKDLMKFAPDDEEGGGGPLAGGPPSQALGFAPDEAGGNPLANGPAGLKMAQASGIDPEIQGMADWSQKRAIDKARQEHFNQKDIDSYDKDYGVLATAGQKAAAGLPQLEMLKNVVNDPRFDSGIGGEGIVLPYKQLMARFGNDPEYASRMELFRKGISGQIVEDMKIMLQGLGQVRVAEIDLLAKSSASLNQSKPGNQAVLELAIRSHKQVNALSKAANLYRQGYSLDKEGNFVYTGQTPTKAGQDALLKRVTEENPILTPQERIKYENLFKPGTYDKQKYEATKAQLEAAAKGETAPTTGPTRPPPPPGFR